jgi:hypothetical protein
MALVQSEGAIGKCLEHFGSVWALVAIVDDSSAPVESDYRDFPESSGIIGSVPSTIFSGTRMCNELFYFLKHKSQETSVRRNAGGTVIWSVISPVLNLF